MGRGPRYTPDEDARIIDAFEPRKVRIQRAKENTTWAKRAELKRDIPELK